MTNTNCSLSLGDSNSAPRYKQFTRSVAILDTKTWTWSIPNVQGIPPSSRAYASAAILDGKHVTFAFGKNTHTYKHSQSHTYHYM
jgi:hypothetical protein